MNIKVLLSIGLSTGQAKVYKYLLENGPNAPKEIGKQVGESRTNTYNLLAELIEQKLVIRNEKAKIFVYRAEPPTALQALTQKHHEKALAQERQLNALMPDLLTQYFTSNEKPGVRFYKGAEELKQIYDDQIATAEPIYIIRPDYNMDIYDFEYMSDIRHLARKAGIKRYAITPDRKMAPKNYQESDPYMQLVRTWINSDDYTSPVEWNAYGDKVAIMSFGKEAIGTIIESPQIAESLRQLYKLLDEGIRRRPNYAQLPKKAQYIGSTKHKNKDKY